MRLEHALALALCLVGCDNEDPAPDDALVITAVGSPSVSAGAATVNDVAEAAFEVRNTTSGPLSVAEACGAPAWTLEEEAGGAWQEVGASPCGEAPTARTLAGGDTLMLRARFTLADLDGATTGLPGLYRLVLNVQRTSDGSALPLEDRLSPSFIVPDTRTTPEPVLFAPGVVASDEEEWRITFTPRGDTAYFARSADFFPFSRQATIYETRLIDEAWTAPVVASFSGQYPDIDPFVSPDGRRLFFSSIRPVDGQPRGDADLWVVEREGEGWGPPVHLGGVNSPSDELYASVDAQGVLYVASERVGGLGGWDLYRATPTGATYGPAENVGAPVNTSLWEFNPTISADGGALVYTGLNYDGGAGLGDLYTTTRTGEAWAAPVAVGPDVNTATDEYHPSFTPDRRHLFFVRRVSQGDLHWVSWPLP